MFWFAMLVVLGYIVYVLKPDERRRVLVTLDHYLAVSLEMVQKRRQQSNQQSDPFHDVLRGRTRGPFVTGALLVLNVAVFAVMIGGAGAVSDPGTLVRWGGSLGPLTTNGQWWRLVTATFVHAGVVHLIVDVVSLSQAAILVERMSGHVVLAGIYMASTIFAAAIGLSGDPLAVAAGASGPIFGIHGLVVALIVRGTLQRSPVTIPLRYLRRLAPGAAIFVLYYMSADGAQWTAGLATFVIGFALGLALTRNVAERTPSARRVFTLVTTATTIAMALVAPLKGMTDVRSEIPRLLLIEDQTAARYRAATDQFVRGAIKADALAQLIERSIVPTLQTASMQFNAVSGVPRQQQTIVSTANQYLRLRQESWTLRATALRKLNMRQLRDADQKERQSLDALEKLRSS